MLTQEELTRAMQQAIERAGSQTALASIATMTQSQISDYSRGRFQVENITIGVLQRIFPEMKILFFGQEPEPVLDPMSKIIESQLLAMFRKLSPEEQVRCFAMISRTFGD